MENKCRWRRCLPKSFAEKESDPDVESNGFVSAEVSVKVMTPFPSASAPASAPAVSEINRKFVNSGVGLIP